MAVKKTKYPYKFHNCPICRAMAAVDKRGFNLSEKELKRAYLELEEKQKSDKKNSIVNSNFTNA